MRLGIDAKVDYAFKRLFGIERNQGILADFLNSVLEPPTDERIVELELLNPFNSKETERDKLSIVDVKARDQSGRQYLIEMQLIAEKSFRERILYYWSRLYSGQLTQGAEYKNLRKTICICILNTNLYPEIEDFHLQFTLNCPIHGVEFTRGIEVHTLELPKVTRDPEQLQTAIECWAFFLAQAASLDPTHLPLALCRPPIQLAVEELLMVSQSELEHFRFEDRLKAELDELSRRKEHEETQRQIEESMRQIAEAERRNAEAARRNAEAARRNAEAERRNAEAARQIAEAERRMEEKIRRMEEKIQYMEEKQRSLEEAERRQDEERQRLEDEMRRLDAMDQSE